MKKTLAFLLITACFTANTQTSSIALFHHETTVSVLPNAIIHMTTVPGPEIVTKKTIDIQNTSPTFSNSYGVKRYDIIVHSLSSTDYAIPNFCFATTCYPNFTNIAPFPLELQPLENSADLGADTAFYSLDADIIDASIIGYSVVKYTVYNYNTVNDSVQFTMIYNEALKEAGIAVNKLSANDLKIYPNPAISTANISFSALLPGDAKITVCNAMGQTVYCTDATMEIGENVLQLDLNKYDSGIYYLELTTPKGTVAKKLTLIK